MLNMVQGNVMRFLPSFLLQREHVDVAMELVYRLLKANVPVMPDTLVAAGV